MLEAILEFNNGECRAVPIYEYQDTLYVAQITEGENYAVYDDPDKQDCKPAYDKIEFRFSASRTAKYNQKNPFHFHRETLIYKEITPMRSNDFTREEMYKAFQKGVESAGGISLVTEAPVFKAWMKNFEPVGYEYLSTTGGNLDNQWMPGIPPLDVKEKLLTMRATVRDPAARLVVNHGTVWRIELN